ncbi:MAG: endonuclease/exonuclease/phosphatase family protein, partial [Chitinophagaceae bacterium]|nr:endonuclease/exonuclease/phosphatase family protein [Chitinophagaceae bacterium]
LFAVQSDAFAISQRADGTLRVMSWNVQSMGGEGRKTADQRRQLAREIARTIRQYNPDVVCLQEFGQFDEPQKADDNLQRMKDLGYKYYVLSKDYSRVHYGYSNGLAIFSKYPLHGKKRVQFTSSPESLLFADLVRDADTIRVFTAHLQSFKLIDKDFDDLEAATSNGNNIVRASSTIFTKMKRAFRNRGAQADQIRPYLDSVPHPEIFCGDLNDVPGSYAYWQMRGRERNDAHLEAGWGIGRTFMALAPTLRIDYIFADNRWQVVQCKTIATSASDHLPVVADLQKVK